MLRTLAAIWILGTFPILGLSQERTVAQPLSLATPAQRLMMEQVEELLDSSETEEAILILERLFDQGSGYVVSASNRQLAATLQLRRFIPLRQWTQRRLIRILRNHPGTREIYQARMADVARLAYERTGADSGGPLDLTRIRKDAERFWPSDLGPELNLRLADLYLERGWSIAAMQAAQRASQGLRALVSQESAPDESLAWPLVWNPGDTFDVSNGLPARIDAALKGPHLPAALTRLVTAAGLDPECVDRPATLAWAAAVADRLPPEQSKLLMPRIEAARGWKRVAHQSGWLSFAGTSTRASNQIAGGGLHPWPQWSVLLERMTASSDRIAASKPRVGESKRGTLPYFPVVYQGKVFVNALHKIVAYDLTSGHPWPDVQPSLPLFDSNIAPAAFLPLGYPLVGTPRGTLEIYDDCLYARMGSPVSGWANREGAADGGSLSYIVGLDLKRQGSLLPGFPLRLTLPEFHGAEFEGAPLVWGDRILVALLERDNVGLRRSVAAFDRVNGKLLWKSRVLAAGTSPGAERANLITHQLLSSAGGRVFYNTNLGAIVCLNPLDGQIEWLSHYLSVSDRSRYPRPNRHRYRDLTPCLISKGMVYCAPQDCPEIFALDATSGDLIWSTDETSVNGCIHLLGIHEDELLVSGDHLVWLDRKHGDVLGRFPGSTTPGRVNALPSPRGLGRAVLAGGNIYWPTASEIYVFPASIRDSDPGLAVQGGGLPPNGGLPSIVARIRLDSRGSEGGNLVALKDQFLFAGPSRLMSFSVRPSEEHSGGDRARTEFLEQQ